MRERLALGVSALGAGALTFALRHDVAWVRGPDYFRWPLTPLSEPALLALLLPLAIALAALWRGRADARSAALLFSAGATYALTLAWLRGDAPPLQHAAGLLESETVHGYLTTARAVCATPEWLASYPTVMADQGVHVRVHPPGLVASYCAMFALTGAGPAAAVGGAFALGALAATTPVWVQALATRLGLDARGALLAGALSALSPASAAFFPSFDAAHPALVAALLWLWVSALDEESEARALGFAGVAGLVGWALSTFSYVLFVVAVPLAILLAVRGASRPRVARVLGASLACFVLLYALAGTFGGLDPFAVFRQALANQSENLETWFPTRAWPTTVGWDLWDFALGLSSVVLVPAALFAQRALASRERAALTVAALGLALPILGALSGQITTETFRTWMFMAPAVHVCAAAELARWRAPTSTAFVTVAALLSASVVQQLAFVWA